ncbi:MAG TPA: hypothetical protein VKB33_08550, partial [Nitrospira sp.]|nr:hypothetical protein [Nitrospira sp.]
MSSVIRSAHQWAPESLAAGAGLVISLLIVVRSASLAALLGSTAQALIRRALCGVVFIHVATLGIRLMIAKAQGNFSLFAIHLDDF